MGKKDKSSWGGKRDGAGRKPSVQSKLNKKKFKTVSISGSEEEIDTLKKQAAEKNKSFSRYVIEELIDEDDVRE